jgi:hypothetical protein
VLFPTHLLAAALVGRLSSLSPLWLVAGAAIPDVVDKPLAMAGFVDLYHSIGHSALLFPLVAVPIALSSRTGVAAAVGWGSHLCLDGLHVVVNGRADDVVFLAWPVAASSDPLAIPPGSFFLYYLGTPSFFLEIVLWTTVLAILVRNRLPAGAGVQHDH